MKRSTVFHSKSGQLLKPEKDLRVKLRKEGAVHFYCMNIRTSKAKPSGD